MLARNPLPLGPLLRTTRRRAIHSSAVGANDHAKRLKDLYAKFQDPNSHYHIPPGTTGPEHEEDQRSSRDPTSESPTSADEEAASLFSPRTAAKLGLGPSEPKPKPHPLASATALASASRERLLRPSSARLGVPDTRPSITWSSPSPAGGRNTPHDRPWLEEESGRQAKALEFFREHGHDTAGVLTWPVAWGDCDMFQHVNNVRILRWIESARVRYWESWAGEMKPDLLENVMRGRGTGMILKDVSIKYKAPITYPDTVMISNRIHSINPERASFGLSHIVWSLKNNTVAAIGEDTTVMYDYDKLRKGVMSDEFREMLEGIVETYGDGSR